MSNYDELLALATEAQTLWYRLAQGRRRSHALEVKSKRRFERRADKLDECERDRLEEIEIGRIMDMPDEEILALPINDLDDEMV